MQFARKRRRTPFINIISLIDILVVLLIFYITTTVFKKAQPMVKIVVPKSSQAQTTQEVPPETLYVTKDKKIFLENQPVEIEKLKELLKGKLAANPNYKIALKADEDVSFGTIVKVNDTLHDCGFKDQSTYMNKPADAPNNP